MFFPFSQRQRLLAQPFPEAWARCLHENVFLYRTLSDAEQARLRDTLRVFIAEKNWEGCARLEVTDEMKVTIAAHACLLLLGFDDYYFDEVQSILVYPGGFLAHDPYEEEHKVAHLAGQAHARGPVVLSWADACWDGRRLCHRNVVLHEFAHQLAALGDRDFDVPPIEDPDLRDRWTEVMKAEYEQLVEDASYHRPTLLHAYGASNPAEFFAVATECFLLRPHALHRRHPWLYQVLAEWYRQEPAARPLPSSEDAFQARVMEDEYARRIIAECSAAIRLHPEYLDAHRMRGRYHHSLGEYDPAIADYSEVIRLADSETRAETHCDRGMAYSARGSHDAAIADLDRAIRLCPTYTRAYCERGIVHARKGDLDRALADFATAIRIDPKDDAVYIERGVIYYEQGEYTRAIRDFSRAIRLYPHGASAYSYRALARIGLGEYDQAIADCEEALQIDPCPPEPYKHRGVAYYHKGELASAIADCTEAICRDPDYVEAYRARAQAYTAAGKEEKSREDDARAEELTCPARTQADHPDEEGG
jgi:Mlc titration factor MtfA (ptsG expression regulator)/Tfp pilus assembly protein PilF